MFIHLRCGGPVVGRWSARLWWLADQVLASSLRWALPVPLMVGQAIRRVPGRGAARPGEEGFERAMCLALAQASAAACRLAGEIAGEAVRLEAVAPKARTKGAGEVIQLLFDEDAVPGTPTVPAFDAVGRASAVPAPCNSRCGSRTHGAHHL
ncbi:hypothetical protein CHELA1G11_20899 [Hyphomicrobiales bacterium]|nr:hypothetical protein CHELA1G11_20899 [Hyphomicrobiales bacterium]CAH1692491.1 hypothetical protein CHELA1G2_21215 [Hyphomicrobiales bacterium]